LWPEIVDLQGAVFATTLGVLANAAIALWLLVLGNMAWLIGTRNTSVWMLPAAAVEAFLAWKVVRLSPRWALVSLADSAIGFGWVLFTRGANANFTIFGLWILLWRIHGVRGTRAYWNLIARR
jgi:hypothetical protein